MPPVMLGNDTMICNNASLQLVVPTGYKTYQWNNGASTNNIVAAKPGTYYLSVTDSCGNQSADTINVAIANTTLTLPADTSICQQDILHLSQNEGFRSYVWQPSNGVYYSNGVWQISPEATTRYQLTTSDNYGCIVQKTFLVNVRPCNYDIWFPNAFSPNNDGLNDTFGATNSLRPLQYLFKIWNRWGQLIFQSTNPQKKWDGKYKGQLQPQSQYVWECVYSFGNNRSGTLKGTVSLLR
jgi:gliding motility-associated-like protein